LRAAVAVSALSHGGNRPLTKKPEDSGFEVVVALAPVVQKLDSAIHRINLYPSDSAIGFPNTYPLDSDLLRWNFEQLALEQKK